MQSQSISCMDQKNMCMYTKSMRRWPKTTYVSALYRGDVTVTLTQTTTVEMNEDGAVYRHITIRIDESYSNFLKHLRTKLRDINATIESNKMHVTFINGFPNFNPHFVIELFKKYVGNNCTGNDPTVSRERNTVVTTFTATCPRLSPIPEQRL